MTEIKIFFYDSELLDYFVLKPLSHIKNNWELTYDKERQLYIPENDSFAKLLNELINDLDNINPPIDYHINEDYLANYVKSNLNWKIDKNGKFWDGASYQSILEQGGFNDTHEKNLILALVGRIKMAIKFKQYNFDDMEKSHQSILASILSIILYHRVFRSIENKKIYK